MCETKTIRLDELCEECMRPVLRCIAHRRGARGDMGDEIITTQVHDRCASHSCGRLIRESTVVNWPVASLDEIFAAYEQGQLTREEFDSAVVAQLARCQATFDIA